MTRQDSYFVGKDITNSWYTDSSDTAGKFSVLTIYKIDEKSDRTTKPLKDNKVDISGLNDENKYSDYLSFNSVQEVLDSLKSHCPGISKMN